MRDIKNKVAWVTGAGTGIGQGCALALSREGVRTALTGRRETPLRDTAAMIETAGGETLVLPGDIADYPAMQAAVEAIGGKWGDVDILVNNAGINDSKRHWADIGVENWKQVIDVNLNGPFHCVHAVLPAMRKRAEGLIINVASWAARFDGYVAGAPYYASKHALLSLNATLNIEEGRHGIRACAICPGEVATPILDKRPVAVSADERAKMLQPEDLAELVVSVARMDPRACVNEILLSPTRSRANRGDPDFFPPPADAEDA